MTYSPHGEGRMDVVVVAAKGDEQRHINLVFKSYFGEPRTFANGLLYEIHEQRQGLSPITIYLTTCGMQGNVSAGITVSEVKYSYFPSIILFVGTAGSLNPGKLRLGDVVLPRAVWARLYERAVEKGQADYTQYAASGKKLEEFHKDTILIPYQSTIQIAAKSLALIGKMDFDTLNPLIRKNLNGVSLSDIPVPDGYSKECSRPLEIIDDVDIFTCDLLVNSACYRNFLAGEIHTKASAIDTESFGHLKAIAARGGDYEPRSLIVRGISDYAGRRTETQKDSRWGAIANRNAAIVAAETIKMFLGIRQSKVVIET